MDGDFGVECLCQGESYRGRVGGMVERVSWKGIGRVVLQGKRGKFKLEFRANRPDLQFAIWMCARYQARPTEKHLHAVKRIFRYLKGTVNRGLWYPKDSSIALTAFAEDAEQCGCQTSAETSGCMQVLGRYRTLLAGHKKGEKRCDIQFWKLNIMLSLEEKELDISYQQAKNAEFYAGDSPNNWQMKLMNSGGTYSNILCRNQQGERSRCILDSVLGLLLNGFASLSFESHLVILVVCIIWSRLRLQDIEDMLILLVQGKLTNLNVEDRLAFGVSLRMFTRSIVIQRRVEDLQLGVESYQKKLNITKPDTYRSDLKRRDAYTAYSNPRGFIYQNKDKKNKLMRIDELHKFSDGTLDDVRTALNDRLKGIRMEYLPNTIWR
ncbi:hypothetical protein Tco_1218266 [Tanacetum coccineum]